MRVERLERVALVVVAIVVVLLAVVRPFSSGGSTAAASEPRIAVAMSQITYDATMPPIAVDSTTPLVLGGTLYSARVRGVEDLMRKEFGATAVARIGDTELKDVKTLEQYDVVVLVRTVALTGAQRVALREYVARGGSLICSFGTGRWDYNPVRKQPYYWLVRLTGSRFWEWGELSELFQVGFVNDPTMLAGFHVNEEPVSEQHPIIERTLAELGAVSLDMTGSVSDCPEQVQLLPRTGSYTPLLVYNEGMTVLPDGKKVPVNDSMAAWVSEYHLGRVVYFGFQIHDLLRGDGVHNSSYATVETQKQASRVFVNAVKWAAQTERWGAVVKDPRVTVTGTFSKGRLGVSQRVLNNGTSLLRGSMQITLYDPAGRVRHSQKLQTKQMTMWPSGSSGVDWYVTLGTAPAKGRWRARCAFSWWDYFRSGQASAARDIYFISDGKVLKPAGRSLQLATTGTLRTAAASVLGANRYQVAANAVGKGWPNGLGASHAIVLATGARPQNALAAAPLAGGLDAPILLTGTSLDPSVKSRLTALSRGLSSVALYVVGSKRAVSDAVVSQASAAVRAAGVGRVAVVRLEGPDDASVAAAVARRVGVNHPGPFADTAFIVNSSAYADALSIAPIAFAHKVPILYVGVSGIATPTQNALDALGVKHTVLVGGPGSVTRQVQQSLESGGHREALQPDNSPNRDTRLWGATRWNVSAAVLDFGEDYAAMDPSTIGVAGGKAWPDALTAGPVLGRGDHPLALVDGVDINYTPAPVQFMMARRGAGSVPLFFGGPASLSPFVRGQLGAILGK